VLLDLLTAVVVAYVGTTLVVRVRQTLQGPARRRWVELVSGLRPRHFFLAPPAWVAVIGVFAALYVIPPLRFGWWTAIGGQGNIVFGTTDHTAGTFLEWLIPLVFCALLLPALPLLVEREERGFRLGAEGWSVRRRFFRGLQFGLLHLLAGIPIAAALALSCGGWWFTWMYLRAYRRGGQQAGLAESTRVHLAYDVEIVLIVVGAIALGS
jgi:hypothetical protein